MEFGKVSKVEDVDFSLPPDDPMTDDLFKDWTVRKEEPIQLHVGCTQWGNKDWIGKVYPKGTKDKDFLAHYVRQFNCIELNALFYNLQPKSVIERWSSLAGSEFRFCPKFLNTISHTKQLQNAQEETALFIDHMQSFGSRLGHSFLQLSDGFGPDRAAILQHYIRQLPAYFHTCVELRQQNWFAGPTSDIQRGWEKYLPAVQETWDLFRELGIGTVITDSSGRRDVIHMKLTAPVAFIRFVANNGHPTDFLRIDAWAERLKTWIGKGLREIYFIVHSHNELHAPELVFYTVEQFNKKCGTDLKPPKLLKDNESKNLTLF
jgi:uncharacterized protein YecE (DUF72 family)